MSSQHRDEIERAVESTYALFREMCRGAADSAAATPAQGAAQGAAHGAAKPRERAEMCPNVPPEIAAARPNVPSPAGKMCRNVPEAARMCRDETNVQNEAT